MRITVIILLLQICLSVNAQMLRQYEVVFKDKLHSSFTLEQPNEFLSERAINRRDKQGIELDSTDLPVSSFYKDELKKINSLKILSESKWFNDVIIGITDTSVIDKIKKLSFVKTVVAIPSSFTKSFKNSTSKCEVFEIQNELSSSDNKYGDAYRQISMLNADYLHKRKYQGEGMRIAVIDAGFTSVYLSVHFKHLFDEERIIGIYDFVDNDDAVYDHSIHGNRVLSTMAANTQNVMVGTAPKAEYLLLRSEDASAEYLLEEYFWTEAAEYADSAGSDILNSSLGYSTYDDSLQNHSYSDMNGRTTRITLSASKAANKGMIVVNSAGNSGNNSWRKIIAPSDAFDILTVGAVDSSAMVANFSSRGPSFDGRIKPDVMSMGQKVIIGLDDGSTATSNGTSFSSPIIAGATACLWQANPSKSWNEIIDAIIRSASKYSEPDSNYGYGIPDFFIADAILKGKTNYKSKGEASVMSYPNPFSNELYLTFRLKKRQTVSIDFIDLNGQLAKQMKHVGGGERTSIIYLKEELNSLSPGLYLVKISGSEFSKTIKVLKE